MLGCDIYGLVRISQQRKHASSQRILVGNDVFNSSPNRSRGMAPYTCRYGVDSSWCASPPFARMVLLTYVCCGSGIYVGMCHCPFSFSTFAPACLVGCISVFCFIPVSLLCCLNALCLHASLCDCVLVKHTVQQKET